MRKLSRFHVAVALLAVLSVVSLLGASLTSVEAPPAGYTSIWATKPVWKNVWWEANPYGWYGLGIWSSYYNSWGRTYLHLLIRAIGIGAGEDVDVVLYGLLYDAAGASFALIKVWSWTLTQSYPDADTQLMVPSQEFVFWAGGPSTADLSLSYYLTGS